jgi:hypothetical protein
MLKTRLFDGVRRLEDRQLLRLGDNKNTAEVY